MLIKKCEYVKDETSSQVFKIFSENDKPAIFENT